MVKTFDMQFIRYMNLFGKITGVSAKHCFSYNNMLVFVVPANDVQRAIGRDNSNLKRLSDIIGKRIRVVAEPRGEQDLTNFVATLVSPAEFERLEVIESNDGSSKEAVMAVTGRENRAMIIGRERAREKELKEILNQYFGIKGFRLV